VPFHVHVELTGHSLLRKLRLRSLGRIDFLGCFEHKVWLLLSCAEHLLDEVRCKLGLRFLGHQLGRLLAFVVQLNHELAVALRRWGRRKLD
jgi:hypothetical protein